MTANIASSDDNGGFILSQVPILNMVDIFGHKFFTRLVADALGRPFTFYCKVTDYASGFACGDGGTEAEAIETATRRIEAAGVDKYIAARDKMIAEYGRANS